MSILLIARATSISLHWRGPGTRKRHQSRAPVPRVARSKLEVAEIFQAFGNQRLFLGRVRGIPGRIDR